MLPWQRENQCHFSATLFIVRENSVVCHSLFLAYGENSVHKFLAVIVKNVCAGNWVEAFHFIAILFVLQQSNNDSINEEIMFEFKK